VLNVTIINAFLMMMMTMTTMVEGYPACTHLKLLTYLERQVK